MKNNVLIFLLILLVVTPLSTMGQGQPTGFVFGRGLYLEVVKTPAITRDQVWQGKLNQVAEGKGIVLSVIKEDRYRRGTCVIVQDQDASRYGLKLYYHLFMNNSEEAAKALPGMIIEFSGQCSAYTPFDSSGRSWIIDIIYESGTIRVE